MSVKKLKTSTLKKVLKWFLSIVLLLFILLASAPYLFKDKIQELLISTLNKNINATVSLEEIDLSFIKSFPLANVTIKQLNIVNKAPFKGDTLFYSEEVNLKMKLTELFKSSDETMQLQSFSTEKSFVNILIDANGNGNYDIAIKKDESKTNATSKKPFSLDIQQYQINDLNFVYKDANSQLIMHVDDIYHSGSGNFAASTLDLNTKTKAKLSLEMEGVNYMNQISVSLDALLGIDLEEYTFSFKENKGFINQLPLEFEGSLKFIGEEMNQSYDIAFHTPTSSFKNLLGIVPAQYSGNLENVKTAGNFDMNGIVKGLLSEKTIPTFDISFVANNAMFKYSKLPKSVENIVLNSRIVNTTGNVNDTHVNVNNLTFSIDKDVFRASASISNVIRNPKVALKANGTINLENIGKAYPIPMEQKLSGILKANVNSSFDMNSIEKKQYQNIKNTGTLSLEGFVYQGNDVANPFFIDKTSIYFNTNNIKLEEFKAKTGETDLSIEGSLNNFYGFLFNKEVLKGTFNLQSAQINVNDFMTESATSTNKESDQEIVKIPAFLDCTIIAFAEKVKYDNINLTNARGVLIVKDQAINLQNLKMNAFSGLIKMNGLVSTKEPKANFKMSMSLENLDIKESFTKLTTLNSIAPIANVIGGKLNSDFKIDGNLSDSMTPDLKTISGDLLGQLINTKLNASNSKLLSFVGKEISFIDVNKLNLEKIKTQIKFENGNVVVKPFQMKYEDIDIEIGGTHGFDQSMNYNLTFNVPAKYLGNDVTSLISKLSKKEQDEISIPIKANLTGSFTNPKIKTDLKEASSNLVSKLVKEQKNKLLDKGKDKLLNLLGKDKDSSKTKKSDLIKNLFKKKKKDN